MKDKLLNVVKNAYAPYSNFGVGCIVVTKDGNEFQGVNVENANGTSICAERNATFAAYSNGYRKEDIEALAIVSDGPRIAAPCGICRQVLCELLEQDTPIYLSNGKEECTTNIAELLPMQYTSEDLVK